MSADLHLYVVGCDQDGWRAARDSPDFNLMNAITKDWEADNIWIGQVSWIKSAFDEDGYDKWVPRSVRQLYALYYDGPILTEGLIKDTLAALNWPDRSNYGKAYYLTAPDVVSANWRFSSSDRKIRAGRWRMIAGRPRGVTRDRRAVKKFLYAHLGQRIVPLSL